MRIINDIKPTIKGSKTQSNLEDQGISYNESGISYNESGIYYGGVYGFSDVQPIFSKVMDPKPSITAYSDIYLAGREISAGQAIGPGFFLFLPYRDTSFAKPGS